MKAFMSKYKYWRYTVYFMAVVVCFFIDAFWEVVDRAVEAKDTFRELVARDKDANRNAS